MNPPEGVFAQGLGGLPAGFPRMVRFAGSFGKDRNLC
jgi:hypothetical protein